MNTKWNPPPEGYLKINLALCEQQMESMHAEARACLEALRAAQMVGIYYIQLETDSANLRRALVYGEYDRAPGGCMISEIRELLFLDFHVLSIQHCNRSCNVCAHELARSSLLRDPDQPCVWHDPVPEFVTACLAHDDEPAMI